VDETAEKIWTREPKMAGEDNMEEKRLEEKKSKRKKEESGKRD
jgi:hypothetical protein